MSWRSSEISIPRACFSIAGRDIRGRQAPETSTQAESNSRRCPTILGWQGEFGTDGIDVGWRRADSEVKPLSVKQRGRRAGILMFVGWVAGDTMRSQSFLAGKPIPRLVPQAAGGTTDAGARLVPPRQEDELPTKVIVTRKLSHVSRPASTGLLNSSPHGYTLSHAVPPAVRHYADPGQGAGSARKDFQPAALHHLMPGVLAVQASTPARRSQIWWTRQKPTSGRLLSALEVWWPTAGRKYG